VLAATARVARDLDVAEECVQDAYLAALDAWTRQGVPGNPAAWLTTTARRKALDALRRDKVLRAKLPPIPSPAARARIPATATFPMTGSGSSSPAATRRWPGRLR
jgi:RNA polymerase sigma-70 factor (ECF subfamily)